MDREPPRGFSSAETAGYSFPIKLTPSIRTRIWGQEDISCIYPDRVSTRERIGEVWLTDDQNTISGGPHSGKTLGELCYASGGAILGSGRREITAQFRRFPLLVKFLFTSDKLSLQVHPTDEYAFREENSSGKTEMWHVVQADAGARLAIGFNEKHRDAVAKNHQILKDAIAGDQLEGMLNWMNVHAGDTFFIPAGCVHAIGGGLIICEIQQNSDVTYRIYDYNRKGDDGLPRQLHVNKALDVIDCYSSGGRTSPLAFNRASSRRVCLAACPYFATEKISLTDPLEFCGSGRFEIWIGIEGEASFDLAGGRADCAKGEALIIPSLAGMFTIRPRVPCIFLRTYEPDLERDIAGPLRAQGYSQSQLSQVIFPSIPFRPAEAI